MSKSRHYQTIKHGKKGTTGLAVVILVVIVILAFGCILALLMTDFAVAKVQESSGVTLQIGIRGDDVIVTIIDGERADELEYIFIEITNHDLSDSKKGKSVEKGQREIIFPKLAEKIRGKHFVGISGCFADGKVVHLLGKQIDFT